MDASTQDCQETEAEIETSTPPSEPQSDGTPHWAAAMQAEIADRAAIFERVLQDLSDRIGFAVEYIHSLPTEPIQLFDAPEPQAELIEPVVEPQPPDEVETGDWVNALLGPTLCSNPKLSDSIAWLETNILQENPQALAFVGHLLVFRCAQSDRKPSLLKDVGESYYRCFPKSRDIGHAFESALVAWLKQQCESAGLLNTIELVHPGERFDAARHAPVERGGVEISEVLGWVVLRDGGKVFSKASVQTR